MRILIIYTIVFASILLLSCNKAKSSKFRADNGIVFDTIFVNKQHFLKGDSSKSSCNIRIKFVYPVSSKYANLDSLQQIFVNRFFGSAYDSLDVQEAVNKYVDGFILNYEQDAATFQKTWNNANTDDIFAPVFTHDDDMKLISEKFYPYNETLSDTVFYNAYGILSFQVKQTNNKGGATTFYSFQDHSLDLNRMEMLTENDIFRSGYDTALQPIFQASLMEQNNVKKLEELEDLGYFGVDEIVPNKNFLVNNKGITYTFNRGEYSAYQLDAPVVFIPYQSIKSLLRDNSPVSNLSK